MESNAEKVQALAPIDFDAVEEKLDDITDIHIRIKKDGNHKFYLWAREKAFIEPSDIPGMVSWLNNCADFMQKEKKGEDFQLEFQNRKYRGHRTHSVSGVVLNIRRIPPSVPTLSELLTPRLWNDILVDSMLDRGGIILIAAETGQGKTSLASAIVKAILEKKAGFALTIEDPPELNLDGEHGHGLCVQTAVSDYPEKTFGAALVAAMRVYPASAVNVLYVGEIRDDDTAAEVIKAAVVGQIVISTIHANSIPSAIERLKALAARRMGGEEALSMVAAALRVCIHQRMRWIPNREGWQAGRYLGNIMISTGDKHKVATHIRKGELHHLEADIISQEAKINNSKNVKEFMAAQEYVEKK